MPAPSGLSVVIAVDEKMIERRYEVLHSEDVLINVLSKLPVKTLLRFRCVCKRWQYLISDDPYLFRLHYSHQSKSNQSFLFNSLTSYNQKERITCLQSIDREGNSISRFQFKSNQDPVLLPTSFDLVCIKAYSTIHVCNPSTHEVITLPELPSSYFPSVGFGYVQSTDEYKVVCLTPHKHYPVYAAYSSTMKCQVFTLGPKRKSPSSSSSSSWAWRDSMDSPYEVNIRDDYPAFVNGAIHWLVFYDKRMINPSNLIVAFDIEREVFRLISFPQGFPDIGTLKKDNDLKLVELRGLLCLSWVKDFKMDIWMFKDYNYESSNDSIIGTWVKAYNIDLNFLPSKYKGAVEIYEPKDIVQDTEVLIEITYNGFVKYLGYYHLKNKSFKKVHHHQDMRSQRISCYTESLRSLKQIHSP